MYAEIYTIIIIILIVLRIILDCECQDSTISSADEK